MPRYRDAPTPDTQSHARTPFAAVMRCDFVLSEETSGRRTRTDNDFTASRDEERHTEITLQHVSCNVGFI